MTTTSLNLSANGMKKHRQSSSWLATLLILAGALMLPLVVDSTTIGDFSYFLLWTFGAIGLAAMWDMAVFYLSAKRRSLVWRVTPMV